MRSQAGRKTSREIILIYPTRAMLESLKHNEEPEEKWSTTILGCWYMEELIIHNFFITHRTNYDWKEEIQFN